MARVHYVVDGYNVIHAWPELKKLLANIDEARDRLIHILTEYAEFEHYELTIVFDALLTDDEEHAEPLGKNARVIYTGAGETADSRIERLAYEEARRGREVHVVTSDGAEQSVILGAGACRVSAAEFGRQVRRVKRELQKEYLGEVRLPLSRLEVSERLDSETARRLDALRKLKTF